MGRLSPPIWRPIWRRYWAMIRRMGKALTLAAIGGGAYIAIELLWRGHTHWTMAVLGGLCFVLIGAINEYISWDIPLILQGVLGAAIVTLAELAAGVVLNLWLGLGIWDYSNRPMNLWGQICLEYAMLWVPLSVVAVVLDDWLRYWLWAEERPYYTLL